MSIFTIIVGVLLFAIATAILYMIGMKKKINQDRNLYEMLLNNAAYRVVGYLKKHETISEDEIAYISKEVKAKESYSKKVAIIRDGQAFKKAIIDYLLKNNYVEKCGTKKGQTLYCLPKKEK